MSKKFALTTFVLVSMVLTLAAGIGAPLRAAAASLAQEAAPTIASDLVDYNPGGTVTLTGANWQGDTEVRIIINDNVGQTWTRDVIVTVAEDGSISDTFQLPNYFVASYLVSASGQQTGRTATTTFTDANPSADLDQCANGQAPSPSSDGCNGTAGTDWENGNLGASKSVYFEGDTIPYRLKFGNLSLASHTVTIEWDTTKSGKHAIDYITSFNQSVLDADPCLGISGCSTSSTFAIPADPQVTGGGVTPIAGVFTLYGGTITAVSAYSYPDGAGFTGDKSAQISITFTASVATPVLAWGGHIATRADWGFGNSAVAIPGSPYHTRLIDLDGSGGNQDRSLSADAVIFPGSITIIKQATPEGTTSFPFTASPAPLADFFLVDDGTSANTQVFGNIIDFQTYSVAETVPSGWSLTGIVCSVTSPNGGSQTVSSPGVSINLKEGENVTCTFSNEQQAAQLTLVKTVVNDNGGSATEANFQAYIDGNAVPWSAAQTLSPGSYTASESTLAGYTASAWGGDCAADGSVTLAAGESKTCTITNDDQQAYVIVEKVVNNDNGGTAAPDDFNLTLDGSPVSSGMQVAVNPGTYTAGETLLSGYSFDGFSGDCDSNGDVTVALGESKTCTLTNSDQQATITVVKVVTNDNGGSAAPNDFNLTLEGNAVSSGVAVLVDPGTYTAGETLLSGYTFEGFSGDCDANGDTTVALGESKTCTLTNNDNQATITVVKVVTNDNGGSAAPNDFNLTLEGNAVGSGVAVPVDPGTYTAGETLLSGYTFEGFSGDCDANGDTTVALGESKTCTLTNNDNQATITVVKVVTNDNGGSAAPNDFNLTLEGNPVSSGVAVPVNPGTYTAGETLLSGYTFEGFSGDCDANGDTTVTLGESKTCTLTNNDIQPKLTLIKTVINNNGGTLQVADFPLFVDATSVNSGETNGFDAGNYTASETEQYGYAASDWGGDCAADGSVTLSVGDDKTCTITNDDIQPKLTLIKTVINDNGGTKTVADFPLFVSGSPVTSGAANGFNAGSYTASETTQYGYTASAWGGDCAANGSVTLSVGDDKTCTITNDDQPGTIIVKKVIKPVGALTSFSFNTTGTGYNNFSLAGGQENSQTLNAGSYTATELVPLGWVLTGIGGSTDPNTPYNCTVTGSGGSTGVGDLNTQTATISLKNGDTVTCVFENTGQGVTRTQGFWATHPQLAEIAWFGGTAFGHTFPGVAGVSGIGNTMLCSRNIDTLGKVMGAFWSDISKKTTGTKRSALDQARMQLLQQLIAAELNASAFGSVPSSGSFAAWEAAYCGTNTNAIKNAQKQAASFNTAGDSGTFTPGTSADSKGARAVANRVFWDILP
jgi:hypothetical protein